MSLGAICEALGRVDEALGALDQRIARGLSPIVKELAVAVLHLGRAWCEQARSAKARLEAAEAVVAAIPDPLILFDRSRRIVGANKEAGCFIGMPAEPCDLATVLRNPAVLAGADAVLRGDDGRVVEFAVTAPRERHFRARFARIQSPSPDGAVAMLILHDVTALKRAEQMRVDFIANASHELRTPLATLAGFIETLLGPARDDPEARERFLAIMQSQAARMTRLVEDLLSLSRIELNEHLPPTDRVALEPVLRHVADMLQLRAGERNMDIVLSIPDDLPDVVGDHDQLVQVFQNLVDNAIKYGAEGTEITVTVALCRRGPALSPSVMVAVRDHGEGIAAEHLPRLTERFYRVDTSRSREAGGTGLGLAIVKHVVNRHRGVLKIESSLGRGSLFAVYLPLAPEAAR